MSGVFERARVRVLLADYAVADQSNKLNVIGGGISLLAATSDSDATAPFALVVLVQFADEDVNAECAVEMVLEDLDGQVVLVPGPSGEPQAMRIAQNVLVVPPSLPPGMYVPRGAVRPQVQFCVNFAIGLPLARGAGYRWRVRIDGESKDEWGQTFAVPGPPRGPVLG